jgi:transcriptional regulator with XRE-family HTH domain
MSLGENVARRRRLLGMTQTELAAAIRVRRRRTTPSYVSRIESGYTDPRASTLRSLARALSCPPWYFFWEPGQSIPFADAYLALPAKGKKEVRDMVRYLSDPRVQW